MRPQREKGHTKKQASFAVCGSSMHIFMFDILFKMYFFITVSKRKRKVSESNAENEGNAPVLPKILDGKYFVLVEFTQHPNLIAQCVNCETQRSAAINGTGNLI